MDQQRPSFVRQFGTSMARHGLALGLTATVGLMGAAQAQTPTVDMHQQPLGAGGQHQVLSPHQFGQP